jgi:LysM repeat protein
MGFKVRSIFRIVFICLAVPGLLSACSPSDYWIPPHAAGQANSQTTTEPDPTEVPEQIDQPGEPVQGETTSANSESQQSENDPAVTNQLTQALPESVNQETILYYTQAADTLPTLAVRFGVQPEEIISEESIHPSMFLRPGQLLVIPRRLDGTTSSTQVLPDSEFVYSPSAAGFDVKAFADAAGGKLSRHNEWHKSTGFIDGAGVVAKVAIENSINPRLLLALLEYESGWVYGEPGTARAETFPLGLVDDREKGLYNQLVWAVNQLSTGYYAWREGRLTEITFPDGSSVRLAPDLNAGTAALMYYFAQKTQGDDWVRSIDPGGGLPALHAQMFGDPWSRARVVEPLFPPDIRQPPLILPFQRNWIWAFTGGPHGAWEREGAYAALDFAPSSTEPGCVRSPAWTLASASGLVTRSGNGVVVLDLDGDGFEQTGWVLVYLHVSSEDRIPVGTWVGTEDRLGHPSCEGGISTGTHVHLARKYNGEWIPASGPIPFNLGGWVSQPSQEAYQGTLVRDGKTITACTCTSSMTFIQRGPDDP